MRARYAGKSILHTHRVASAHGQTNGSEELFPRIISPHTIWPIIWCLERGALRSGLDDWEFSPVGITDGTSLEACLFNRTKTALKSAVMFYDAISGKLLQNTPLSISGGTGGCVQINGASLGQGSV
jgi:hypothetical protein